MEPFLDRARDSRIILLSNSPQFLVGRIAHRLRIEEWRGSEYLVDKEKNFCDISSLMDGPEKLRLIKALQVRPEEASAYSDSDDDLPLLEWVGNPFAVKPNRRLRKAATLRGWPIIE